MAGMFSLLRKSQIRLDAAAGSTCGEDASSDFRKKSHIGSPFRGNRILGIRRVHMKAGARSSDRVPKRFRKSRCSEIHPLLRRSVCTLLLAGAGISTGLAILLVDHYTYKSISRPGIIVLSASVFLFLIGIAWFWCSLVQLRKFRKKISELQAERETQRGKVSTADQIYPNHRAYDPAAVSASKWPTKLVIPEENSDAISRKCSGCDVAIIESDVAALFAVTDNRVKKKTPPYVSRQSSLFSECSIPSDSDTPFQSGVGVNSKLTAVIK